MHKDKSGVHEVRRTTVCRVCGTVGTPRHTSRFSRWAGMHGDRSILRRFERKVSGDALGRLAVGYEQMPLGFLRGADRRGMKRKDPKPVGWRMYIPSRIVKRGRDPRSTYSGTMKIRGSTQRDISPIGCSTSQLTNNSTSNCAREASSPEERRVGSIDHSIATHVCPVRFYYRDLTAEVEQISYIQSK